MTQNELKKLLEYLKLHDTLPPMLTSTEERAALLNSLEKHGWKYDDDKERFTKKSALIPGLELFGREYNAALEMERQQMDPPPKLSESTENFNSLHLVNFAFLMPQANPAQSDPNSDATQFPKPKAFSVLLDNNSAKMLNGMLSTPEFNDDLRDELLTLSKKLKPDVPLFGDVDIDDLEEEEELDEEDKARLKALLDKHQEDLGEGSYLLFSRYFNLDGDWNDPDLQQDTQNKLKSLMSMGAIMDSLDMDNPMQKQAAKGTFSMFMPESEANDDTGGSKLGKSLLGDLFSTKLKPTDDQ